MRAPLTVLLTGASGDVGREIHRVLKAKGVTVVPVSSKDREGWVKWDLKNPAPPNAPKKVDAVVSCVGHRPKHLLEYAKKSAKHVVHIGSIATEQKGNHDAYSGGKAGGRSLSGIFKGKQHSFVRRLPGDRMRQREQVGGKVQERKASRPGDRPLLSPWPCPGKDGGGGGVQGSSSPRAKDRRYGATQNVRRHLRVRPLLRLRGHGLHRDGLGVGPAGRQGNWADRPWHCPPLQRCPFGSGSLVSIGQHAGVVVHQVPLGFRTFCATIGWRAIRRRANGTEIVKGIVGNAVQE